MSGLELWPYFPMLQEVHRHLQWTRPGCTVSAFHRTYVAINTVISVTVAPPAADAFNRYAFIGEQHPVLLAARTRSDGADGWVFAMPFFNLDDGGSACS